MRKLLLATIIIAVLLCVSCAGNDENCVIYHEMLGQLEAREEAAPSSAEAQETAAPSWTEAQETPSPIDPTPRKGQLTITGVFIEGATLECMYYNAIEYMKLHPDVVIKVDKHSDYRDYNKRFPVMLMSGEIGDIVVLPGDAKPQMISEAYFVDIYPLMQNDAYFCPNDYFMNILTAYETEGKLFRLCSNFSPRGQYMARKDVSQAITDAFSSDAPLSYNDMIELYLSEASARDGEWSFTRDFTIIELFFYNFDKLVDFESKKANFTEPEFIELLERVRDAVPIDTQWIKYTANGLERMISSSSGWGMGDLTERGNSFVFKDMYFYEAESLYPLEGRIFTIPKAIATAGGNYLFEPMGNYAINKSCADPELAWDFIKFIISRKPAPEVQGEGAGAYQQALFNYQDRVGLVFPVNRRNCKTFFELKLEAAFRSAPDRNGEESEQELAAARQDYMNAAMAYLIVAAEKCNLSEAHYSDLFTFWETGIIWDDLYLYLTDRQSAEQSMRNIENKMQLWLNE